MSCILDDIDDNKHKNFSLAPGFISYMLREKKVYKYTL